MNILFDAQTPVLNTLIIQGRLIFDNSQTLSLDAYNIIVQDGGYLQIGTLEAPLENQVTITLHGTPDDVQLMHHGNKVIVVINSKIDIHGKERDTWTRVASTINVGDTSFTTTMAMDWQVGDVVVIASSSYDMNEAEMKTISSVTNN